MYTYTHMYIYIFIFTKFDYGSNFEYIYTHIYVCVYISLRKSVCFHNVTHTHLINVHLLHINL